MNRKTPPWSTLRSVCVSAWFGAARADLGVCVLNKGFGAETSTSQWCVFCGDLLWPDWILGLGWSLGLNVSQPHVCFGATWEQVLTWTCSGTSFLPGLAVCGRDVVFRVCEELNAAFCHQYYVKVSLPCCSTMTALSGASKQLYKPWAWAVSLSRCLPGWGLGIPPASLVSAPEIKGICSLMAFKVLVLSGISANEWKFPFVLMGFLWSFS